MDGLLRWLQRRSFADRAPLGNAGVVGVLLRRQSPAPQKVPYRRGRRPVVMRSFIANFAVVSSR
jgi:hypothetical protein